MKSHNSQSNPLPLEGLCIVDFSHFIAGPFTTQILADLGASVIKIENLKGGESGRYGPPFVDGQSHYFLSFNRNKQSVALNLKDPRGKKIAIRLIKQADVLVENFAVGVMGRLGFGHKAMTKLNPNLIYCSVSGFGQSGPLAEKRSYDLIAQAYSGVMSANGERGSSPLKIGIPIGDTTAGLYATISILSALLQRKATGAGQRLDISMYDGLLAMLANHGGYYLASGEQAEKWGSQHYISVPNGVFPVKDGFIAIAAVSDLHWQKLCKALGMPQLSTDPLYAGGLDRAKNRGTLETHLLDHLAEVSVVQAVEILDAAEVPCGPVQSIGEALEHPHIQSRGMLLDLNHPAYGALRVTGSPLGPNLVRHNPSAPPLLGENTKEILASLGYDEQDITQLMEDGVIAAAELDPSRLI